MATNIYGSADTMENKVETKAAQEAYDRLISSGVKDPGFTAQSWGAITDPVARQQYLNTVFGYGQDGAMGPSSVTPTGAGTYDINSILKLYGGGGSGSGSGLSSADVALKEFQYQKQKDAAELARQQAANQALLDYYAGGAFTAPNADVMAKIANMATKSGEDVTSAYNTAIGNIGTAYEDALGLSELGYGALEQYLAENPNDPYAGLTPTVGTISNPMEALLSAYGVGAEPVRAQVAAEQLAGNQGGKAFQDLINVLSKASQAADKSRRAESKMGREASKRTLGAQKAGMVSQAEATRASALSQIAQRQREQELEQEIATANARLELERQLAGLGLTPPKGSGPGGALTELEQVIRSGGGNTTEAQFQKGIDELASILGGIGFQG